MPTIYCFYEIKGVNNEFGNYKNIHNIIGGEKLRKSRIFSVVTQPTVTKRIKELESEMGKTLFNKNGNSISLTKEGVIFLDYALKYEELEKKVHSDFHATNIYTDTVNIGSTKCIYESHLRKPTLQLMNDKEKSLSVNVRLDHSKLLYSGLKQ